MTQDAVVTKVFPNGMAEVAVSRGTACGSNCGNCESCVFQNEIKAFAKNTVHARPGEKVIIEPFIMFFTGYAIAAANNLSEGLSVLCSFAAFCLAAAAVIIYQRISKRKNPIKFVITQLR